MKIRLLRRSKCLFLPDTPEARAKVTKILGLEVPEFPNGLLCAAEKRAAGGFLTGGETHDSTF